MTAHASTLERQIATERAALAANLDELKDDARRLLDWRASYDAHPLVGLGIAVAGGVVAAAIVTPRARIERRSVLLPTHSSRSAEQSPGAIATILHEIEVGLGAFAVSYVVDWFSRKAATPHQSTPRPPASA